MATVGPSLYPAHLPVNPNDIYAGPSWQHPLGTDFDGADVLAEIVTGSTYVLESALLAAAFAVLLAIVVITNCVRTFSLTRYWKNFTPSVRHTAIELIYHPLV